MIARKKIRAKVGFWVRRFLEKRGYAVQRMPRALIEHPEAVLQVNLDFAVAQMMKDISCEDFTFLQVGAYDGITNDPIHAYIERYHWRGILLEPEPQAFALLQKTYNDRPQLKLLNLALAESDGSLSFFHIRAGAAGLPEWSRQISTLNVETLLKHRDGAPDYGITEKIEGIDQLMEEIKVEGITFNRLLDTYSVGRIDLLQIDAEGYDNRIIQSIPFDRIQPRLIRYEHMHLEEAAQDSCLRILIQHGYKIALEFADTLAYRMI